MLKEIKYLNRTFQGIGRSLSSEYCRKGHDLGNIKVKNTKYSILKTIAILEHYKPINRMKTGIYKQSNAKTVLFVAYIYMS